MLPDPATNNRPKSDLIIIGFIATLLIAFMATDVVLSELVRFASPFLIDALIAAAVIAATLFLRLRHGPISWLNLTGWFVGLVTTALVLRIIAFAAGFFGRIVYCGITGCEPL
jgi:hypothetical protein